jgi:hypothetical protein
VQGVLAARRNGKRAPRSSKASASARPMPDEAPMIQTRCSFQSMMARFMARGA